MKFSLKQLIVLITAVALVLCVARFSYEMGVAAGKEVGRKEAYGTYGDSVVHLGPFLRKEARNEDQASNR